MSGRSRHDARWAPFVWATLITAGFVVGITVGLKWAMRGYGRTVIFTFALNWMLIGWAIGLSQLLESRRGAWDGIAVRLPASWYELRPFEKSGRSYTWLGVGWYRRLFRPVLWSVKPARLRSERDGRQILLRATRDPEAGHLVIFVVILGITIWALVRRWWDGAAWLMLFNILHNAYPVLSLRQIRARLERRGAGASKLSL